MGIANFFIKFFSKFSPEFKPEDYTYEQLKELEAQGCDVAQYLEDKIKAEQKAQEIEQIRFEDLDFPISDIPNPTDLGKLKPFLTKLDSNPDLITKSIDPPLMGKDKWLAKVSSGEIIFGSVVQAAPNLWKEKAEVGYSYAVFILVEKGTFKNNPSFLKLICSMLNDFRDEDSCPENVSKEMQQLYKDLDDPDSRFDLKLDQSILDFYQLEFEGKKVNSDEIRLATKGITDYEKGKFPNTSFPTDGILPLIAFGDREDFQTDYKFVNGEFYKV